MSKTLKSDSTTTVKSIAGHSEKAGDGTPSSRKPNSDARRGVLPGGVVAKTTATHRNQACIEQRSGDSLQGQPIE